MKYTNLKKASDYKVQAWLEKELNLTNDQKRLMYNNEVLRWSPFDFYEDKKHQPNFWIRLSIIFLPIVFIGLLVALFFNFIFSGKWGFKDKSIQWYSDWTTKLGL